MNNMMLWVAVACDVLCLIAFAITPFVTRKTELFGVSLPSSEIGRPELSAMRYAYLRLSLIAGAVVLVLTFLLFGVFQNDIAQVRVFLILLVVFMVAEFLIYLAFHWRMQAFKASQPWRAHGAGAIAAAGGSGDRHAATGETSGASGAEPVLIVDTASPTRDVIHPGWLWIYAAVGGGTLLYLWNIWASLPDRMPVHMNGAGVVDGWADKTPGGFVTLMSGQWIMIAVFVLVYFMIPLSKRQIDAANPAVSREQGRRFRYRMSACLLFGGAALSVVTGLMPIFMVRSDGGMAYAIIPMVLVFAITAVIIIVAYRTGQGGSRLSVDKPEQAGATGQKRMANTDTDSYWKLGMFYFNPKDPAAFVEKRFGVGWTINLGHPIGWVIIGVIVVVVVVVLVLARTQS